MPFVLMIIALLGGLQIYFFGVADRAQKSVAAQVMLSRSSKNINQEVYLEQLLTVQVQELMRRESISGLDLEKGVSSLVNSKNPDNPAEDQASPLFTPTKKAKEAAELLTTFRKMTVSTQDYMVKAFSSSLPRDPTGYVDLAVCPVRKPGMAEIDRRTAKKVRVRLSVKSGFLNAVTGNKMYNVFFPGEIYGNVAEFGRREWGNQWQSTRVYGKWLSNETLNEEVKEYDGWPYNWDGGTEDAVPMSTDFFVRNEGPRREFNVMTIDKMKADHLFKPRAFDGTTINKMRYQPWNTWRWWAFALDGTQGNYDGPELAWNPQTRSRSLPKFNPDMARLLARGEIEAGKAGTVVTVPYGYNWGNKEITDSIKPDVSTGLTIVDGNLVLDGRDKPFRICGRVFVSGDIVVMGKYRSKNADDQPCPSTLIAGRNLYVADNLVADQRAAVFDKTKQANVDKLALVSVPAEARKIAEEIVDADQLVLLATNNLVMGNPFPFDGKYRDVGGRRFIEPSIVNESSVIAGWQGLDKYKDQLFYHRETGVLAQPNPIGLELCMTLPWENVELTCRTREADGTFSSNQRFVEVKMPDEAFLKLLDPLEGYQVSTSFLIPEGYYKLFLPMNVTDRSTGEMTPWITEKQYATAVRNLADYNKYVKPDACGRRPILLNTQLPYRNPDVLKKPKTYKSSFVRDVDPDDVLAEVDKASGFLTKYGADDAAYAEVRGGNQMKVRDLMKQGIQLCIERAKASNDADPLYANKLPKIEPLATGYKTFAELVGKGLYEGTYSPSDIECNQTTSGLTYQGGTYKIQPFYSGATENVYGTPGFRTGDYIETPIRSEADLKGRGIKFDPTWAIHGSTFPEAYLHVRCFIGFYVAQKTATCDPAVRPKLAYSNDMNYWEGPGYIPDADGGSLCNLSPDESSSGNSFAKPTCARQIIELPYKECDGCYNSGSFNAAACKDKGKKLFFWNNAPAGMPREDYAYWGADLQLKMYYDDAWQLHMELDTRFLDGDISASGGARENVLQNRVKEVDAFLFSNQFIAHIGETVHDRQVQINGGIAGRDFLGLLQSKVGPYRPTYDSTDATAAYRTWYAGKEEPGIVVAWDPRFKYSEDIMQSDVGSSELTENSAEVAEICAKLETE